MNNIPDSKAVYAGFRAHNLGFIDGTNAAQSGAPVRFQPQRDRSWSQLCDDEYRRGWDEALEATMRGAS